MKDGWIKIHRKFLDWEWFDKPEMVKFFLTILFMANYEDKKWCGITVKRGQFITSRGSLSKIVGMSERTVRTCIERLKSTNEITTQTTNRYTLITICKYEQYQQTGNENDQQNDQPTDQQATNKRPTNDQQTTTTKEIKEYKKDKNIKKEKTPPTPKGEQSEKKIDKIKFYLSVTPDEWKLPVKNWLEYKQTRGQLYKTEKTFKTFLKKVKDESGDEVSNFIEAVEQSIKNNWSGVFPKQKEKPAFARHNNTQKEYEKF